MSLAQTALKDIAAFCFAAFVFCWSGTELGQAIAYQQVTQECNKLGGFYYQARVFECKEKKT